MSVSSAMEGTRAAIKTAISLARNPVVRSTCTSAAYAALEAGRAFASRQLPAARIVQYNVFIFEPGAIFAGQDATVVGPGGTYVASGASFVGGNAYVPASDSGYGVKAVAAAFLAGCAFTYLITHRDTVLRILLKEHITRAELEKAIAEHAARTEAAQQFLIGISQRLDRIASDMEGTAERANDSRDKIRDILELIESSSNDHPEFAEATARWKSSLEQILSDGTGEENAARGDGEADRDCMQAVRALAASIKETSEAHQTAANQAADGLQVAMEEFEVEVDLSKRNPFL